MLSRTLISCFAIALASGCVTTTTTCAERPTDPNCQSLDGGGDSGHDGGPVDAHVPCNGTCEATLCIDDECVECAGDGDCGAEVCNTTTHECVGCLGNANCTSVTASRCDATSTCVECMVNDDCMHLAATQVCDEGTCVECASNDDCEATEGCSPETHTCVTFTAGSAGDCDGCVRDAQCRAGQVCVAMVYDDPSTPPEDTMAAGQHCLWRRDAGGTGAPNGACSTIPPYFGSASATSVDGVADTVCTLRRSTCEAHDDFTMVDCMTVDAAGDARCGREAIHDGICRMVDAAANRCTVFCTSNEDCPPSVACVDDDGAAATPSICEL